MCVGCENRILSSEATLYLGYSLSWFSLPHISLVLEKMFRGSTNGSSSSDDEIHGGVHGDHGYVTQTEFVGLRHFLRDNLGRYERRLQAQENNFNERMHAQEASMGKQATHMR